MMPLTAQAANILWVSDNGPEGTATGTDNVGKGNFLASNSSPDGNNPFVDQGFVDLLAEAGHAVSRFNPRSGALSLDDVETINTFDLVIVGSATNSGPFNLNAQGPKWNTLITKPMITTKSTLIRANRMGYLLNNFEYDCGADLSTTASGKVTFVQPQSDIFTGIPRTGNVMDSYSSIIVPTPTNNRGTSVQFFKLLVGGVEQTTAPNNPPVNTMEPGGVSLATIEFNPLNPGVNIATGVTPSIDPNYVATGYAIAEWPARSRVRSTQVSGGEPLGGYRMFFGCGTRDASGSSTSAPNPQAGALDLTPEGQQMFLNAIQHALVQPSAPSNWNNVSTDYKWNPTSTNWNSPATGWVSDEDAIFSSAAAGVVGTVTLDASVNAHSVTVSVPGYSLASSGGSTLNLTGNATITADAPFSIAAPITGTSGLTVRGSSAVSLEAANTYTGPTKVKSGTLILHAPTTGNNASPYAIVGLDALDAGATLQQWAGAPTPLGGPYTNGSLNRAANGQIYRFAPFVMTGGTFDLNGEDNTTQWPAPSGTGIITNSSPYARAAYRIGLASGQTATFSGVIQNGNNGVVVTSIIPNTAPGVTPVTYKQGYRMDLDLQSMADDSSVFVLAGKNTFTGFTRIGGGRLSFTGNGRWGVATNTGDANTSTPPGSIICNGGNASLRVDFNGTSQTTGGLSGNGGVYANNRANTCSILTVGAANLSSPTGTGTQTIEGYNPWPTNNATHDGGKIVDNTTGTGGKVALTKIGTGTILMPTPLNTYSGPTLINNGVLYITASGVPSPNSPIQINNNGATTTGQLKLGYEGNKPVRALLINGVQLPIGNYDATTYPGLILGTGGLTVTSDDPVELSNLTVTIEDTDVFVRWTGCGVLQWSSDLLNWTELPGATSPYNTPFTPGKKFWRLRL